MASGGADGRLRFLGKKGDCLTHKQLTAHGQRQP
jgi:hypothetical protein